MSFTPFPELQTKRLILRQVLEKDSPVILYLRSDPNINKYIQRAPKNQTNTIADANKHINMLTEQIVNNTSITWGITIKGTPELIGTICLWNFSDDHKTAEVGYNLSTTHQNKGIMTEAIQSVISFGLHTLNFNTIVAYTQQQNANSIKLLERNGFCLNKNKKDADNSENLIFEIFIKD